MDFSHDELQFLTIPQLLKESIYIPRFSPRTFSLITLSLILPLSFAILIHTLFTHPLMDPHADPRNLHRVLLYQFIYLIFLFIFSLLSTAAVVFTVASLYTSKPISFSSTLHAIPRVFRRLFITFIFIALLMFIYNAAFIASVAILIFLLEIDTNSFVFILVFLLFFAVFLTAHVYITALWHLASVATVLEPIQGIQAMRKSRELLRGKTRDAAILVLVYFALCSVIGSIFRTVVVKGARNYGVLARIFVGAFLLGLLVMVNLVGLLVQSVFYYVCKSYHHQPIDKSALHDHLGGYLGEYVPLKSSIQMEGMDI